MKLWMIRNRTIWVMVFSLFCLSDAATQVYKFNFKDRKTEIISAGLLNVGIHIYDVSRSINRIENFRDIDATNVSVFDRSAIDEISKSAGKASDILLYGSFLSPLALSFAKTNNDDSFGNLMLMAAYGYMIQESITSATKIWVGRPRPYVYREGIEYLESMQHKTDTKSFFSGHTSTSSYLLFYSAKVFSDLHPGSKLRPLVWTISAAIPAFTGFSRYKAGKHFPTDVITGYAVGAAFGILIPEIYKNDNLTISGQADGLSLILEF